MILSTLCIFKQASACQPPTREICCIGPGIVDSWEKELYIMLDIMCTYIYIYISKYIYVYFEGLHENHACARLVRLQLGQIQVASMAIHLHLLHGHRPRSRPDQIQNPKSKLQTARLDFGFRILDFGFWILDFGFWILDFGFWISDFGFRILDFGFWISLVFVLFVAAPNGPVWILDFGFWISDFGFWILDQFSLRSFCGGPKRPRLDFGFWILDFGFWILDFGLGLGSVDTVWILHKIFTYARRMPSIFGCGLSGRGKKCNAYLGFFRRMATTSKSSLRRPGKSVTATTDSFCQGILCP